VDYADTDYDILLFDLAIVCLHIIINFTTIFNFVPQLQLTVVNFYRIACFIDNNVMRDKFNRFLYF
jgi:hypothetical protein